MDYRELPQSELNSNIPQGRGMIKWAPFATMPEQYENVNKMIEAQAHVPVNTIFTVEMAYKNARLLMKPEADWLTPATKKEVE